MKTILKSPNMSKKMNCSKTIYTCGRMHKPRKQKLTQLTARAKVVVAAVYKAMQEELSSTACERWCSRLNAELGCGVFGPSGGTLEAQAAPVPRAWVPAKPKLTLALLDELVYAHEHIEGKSLKATIGLNGEISKVLARHAVERLRREKGFEWLKACSELSNDQLDDPVKLNQALSRVAFDLLVYLHARAEELRREDEIDAVLELHSSDQALVGRSTRGCGLVHCEAGRAILSRAATLVREGLK